MNKGQVGLTLGVAAVVVFFIALFVLIAGFDTVDASHLGVMNRFGEIKGVMHPGMMWTGLFVHVYQYDLRTRPVAIELTGADSAATKDGQSVFASIKINWKIKPDSVQRIYENVGTDNQIYDILNIEGRIKHSFKSVTVKYKDGLEIINNRDQVIAEAIEQIKHNFPDEYAEIEYVVVSNIYFAPEYQAQIDAKKAAEQEALKAEEQVKVIQAEARKRVAEAEGLKEARIQAADADKYERIAAAEGTAKAIELQGEAEAKALAAKKVQLTDNMVANNWVDAWREGGAQVPKWITSGESGNFLMSIDTNDIQ